MHPQLLLFLSPVPTLLRSRAHRRESLRHAALKRTRPALRAGPPPPPPKVKPAFYKNPSKAIEKGGGFYIPGLRGPRLRVAVSLLSGTLLALNHISAAAAASQASLQASEALAAAGCVSVLATALVDLSVERAEAAAVVQSASATTVIPAPAVASSSGDEDSDSGGGTVAEVLSWATAVVNDLTKTTSIAVCRKGRVLYATGRATAGVAAGKAVERVAEERRVLYVDDSSTLPPGVSFPFLEAGKWGVFLVPVGDNGDVVSFVGEGGKDCYGKSDRAWLMQMAQRIAGGCQNATV